MSIRSARSVSEFLHILPSSPRLRSAVFRSRFTEQQKAIETAIAAKKEMQYDAFQKTTDVLSKQQEELDASRHRPQQHEKLMKNYELNS